MKLNRFQILGAVVSMAIGPMTAPAFAERSGGFSAGGLSRGAAVQRVSGIGGTMKQSGPIVKSPLKPVGPSRPISPIKPPVGPIVGPKPIGPIKPPGPIIGPVKPPIGPIKPPVVGPIGPIKPPVGPIKPPIGPIKPPVVGPIGPIKPPVGPIDPVTPPPGGTGGDKGCHPCKPGCKPWWWCATPIVSTYCKPCYPVVYTQPITVHMPVATPVAVPVTPVTPDAPAAEEPLMKVPVGATLVLQTPGLGDSAGQVMIQMDKLAIPAMVNEWKPDAVTTTLPMFSLASPVTAEIVMVKADGTVANTLKVELINAQPQGQSQPEGDSAVAALAGLVQ
jgi:hypothetical protein